DCLVHALVLRLEVHLRSVGRLPNVRRTLWLDASTPKPPRGGKGFVLVPSARIRSFIDASDDTKLTQQSFFSYSTKDRDRFMPTIDGPCCPWRETVSLTAMHRTLPKKKRRPYELDELLSHMRQKIVEHVHVCRGGPAVRRSVIGPIVNASARA